MKPDKRNGTIIKPFLKTLTQNILKNNDKRTSRVRVWLEIDILYVDLCIIYRDAHRIISTE